MLQNFHNLDVYSRAKKTIHDCSVVKKDLLSYITNLMFSQLLRLRAAVSSLEKFEEQILKAPPSGHTSQFRHFSLLYTVGTLKDIKKSYYNSRSNVNNQCVWTRNRLNLCVISFVATCMSQGEVTINFTFNKKPKRLRH